MPWTRFVTICKLPFSSVREWRARNIKIDKIELHTFARDEERRGAAVVSVVSAKYCSQVRMKYETKRKKWKIWFTVTHNVRCIARDHALPKNSHTDDSDPQMCSVHTMHNDVCRAISFLGCKWIRQRSLNDACLFAFGVQRQLAIILYERKSPSFILYYVLCVLGALFVKWIRIEFVNATESIEHSLSLTKATAQ